MPIIYPRIDTISFVTSFAIDTIELRQGTPFHDDIRNKWSFPLTKAISHCNYKCNRVATNSTEIQVNTFPNQGEAILYNEGNFDGISLKLNISGCTNITGYWEGLAESVRIGNNTCVKLFDRRNCTGESLVVNSSISALSMSKFDGRTRSIQECFVRNVTNINIKTGLNNVSTHTFVDQANDGTGHSHIANTFVILFVVVGIVGSVVVMLHYYKRDYPYGHVVDRVRAIWRHKGRSGYGNRIVEEANGDDYNSRIFNFNVNNQNVDVLS